MKPAAEAPEARVLRGPEESLPAGRLSSEHHGAVTQKVHSSRAFGDAIRFQENTIKHSEKHNHYY